MDARSEDIECGDCPTSSIPLWATLPENDQVCLVQIRTESPVSTSTGAERPVECVYPLGRGRAFHIGRHSGDRCIVVDDVTVSRRHALLVHKGDTLYLRDHSSNGSFINDRQIGQSKFYAVHIGDVLRFGDNSLRFRVSDTLSGHDPALIVRDRARRRREGSGDTLDTRSVTSLSESSAAERPGDARRQRATERFLSIADSSAASAATDGSAGRASTRQMLQVPLSTVAASGAQSQPPSAAHSPPQADEAVLQSRSPSADGRRSAARSAMRGAGGSLRRMDGGSGGSSGDLAALRRTDSRKSVGERGDRGAPAASPRGGDAVLARAAQDTSTGAHGADASGRQPPAGRVGDEVSRPPPLAPAAVARTAHSARGRRAAGEHRGVAGGAGGAGRGGAAGGSGERGGAQPVPLRLRRRRDARRRPARARPHGPHHDPPTSPPTPTPTPTPGVATVRMQPARRRAARWRRRRRQ